MCVLQTFSEEARSKQQEELLSAGDKLTKRRSQRLVRALGCSLSVSFLFLILPFGLLRGLPALSRRLAEFAEESWRKC